MGWQPLFSLLLTLGAHGFGGSLAGSSIGRAASISRTQLSRAGLRTTTTTTTLTMVFDALGAALSGDSLPKSKGGLFSAAAGATALAAGGGKRQLLVESLEFCGLPLNKLNDGSRGSQEVLTKFNLEMAAKVASAVGATVVVGSSAQLAACKGKKCLAGEVGKVRGALCFAAPASANEWKVIGGIADADPKRAIVVVNGVRNTMPLDGSMVAFQYSFYLRRLTYGLLLCAGVGRDWRSFLDYRKGKPEPADNYGTAMPTIVQVSGDLQGRAGYMKMGG